VRHAIPTYRTVSLLCESWSHRSIHDQEAQLVIRRTVSLTVTAGTLLSLPPLPLSNKGTNPTIATKPTVKFHSKRKGTLILKATETSKSGLEVYDKNFRKDEDTNFPIIDIRLGLPYMDVTVLGEYTTFGTR